MDTQNRYVVLSIDSLLLAKALTFQQAILVPKQILCSLFNFLVHLWLICIIVHKCLSSWRSLMSNMKFFQHTLLQSLRYRYPLTKNQYTITHQIYAYILLLFSLLNLLLFYFACNKFFFVSSMNLSSGVCHFISSRIIGNSCTIFHIICLISSLVLGAVITVSLNGLSFLGIKLD